MIPTSLPLHVLILTHNEERHIARAIRSVAPFARYVTLVDSFSSDRTVEIAQSLGATVLQRPWINYADQFRWGLAQIANDAEWIMRLDADEVIEPDLSERILEDLPKLDAGVVGINIDRKHIFMGRWIRHGGRYPLTLLRIFRKGAGRIEQRWMDEHILVDGGTVHFKGGFSDQNLNDLTFFTEKHNKYAVREAIDILNGKYHLIEGDGSLTSKSTSHQTWIKRLIKEKIYNQMPFWLGPSAYFFYRYLFQLGFLDGREGLIYHFLQGYWYRFLVGAKVFEYEAELSKVPTRAEKLATLERLTGHKLGAEPAASR